jgi:hypothetical protein
MLQRLSRTTEARRQPLRTGAMAASRKCGDLGEKGTGFLVTKLASAGERAASHCLPMVYGKGLFCRHHGDPAGCNSQCPLSDTLSPFGYTARPTGRGQTLRARIGDLCHRVVSGLPQAPREISVCPATAADGAARGAAPTPAATAYAGSLCCTPKRAPFHSAAAAG